MIDECLLVEVRVTGDDCPLADATRTCGVAIDALPPQLRSDGYALLRFSAPADSGLAAVLDDDERIRYLHTSTTDGRENFRCLSKRPCVLHELTDVGFLSERLRYRDGVEYHAGAVVGRDVLQGVIAAAGRTVGVTLQRVSPLADDETTPVGQRWDLTPAQEAALRTAYEMGYFAVPKRVTADAVADELGVSKSALLERLRRGQATLFGELFG
ncbi:helix-turn-helix domain-containing protein [Haloarculaceae archaeon H-GB2-1]|nr:helix-turn-helix domain-containing protein [Haloarculaceae archaeon H-GB1-1]MEA5386038.1 helix-turn-helix domain-containing protein [Haloarculaceae archaeon H-GB11]MEA5407543.1 helix-turn-helix domain-containing protein [Haloarculaceae archaeon H-GB2-1]